MAIRLLVNCSIFLPLVLLSSLQAASHGQQPNPVANPRPCGAANMPDWLLALIPQDFRGADFRGACHNHDDCYGATNQAKRQCDLAFRCHLIQACANSQRPTACRVLTRNMYRAVAISGKPAFRASRH